MIAYPNESTEAVEPRGGVGGLVSRLFTPFRMRRVWDPVRAAQTAENERRAALQRILEDAAMDAYERPAAEVATEAAGKLRILSTAFRLGIVP